VTPRDPVSGTLRRMRVTVLICTAATLAALSTACPGETIVNTGEPPPATPMATSPAPSTVASNVHLANAFDYVAHPQGDAVYYFVTPSGRWACAIVPHVKAGCQSAARSGSAMPGAPEVASGPSGEATPANAIVVEREGDARFVALEAPEFVVNPGPAKELPFNRILAVAGFRCNVQESAGVACMSEISGKGFTFSQDGFVPQYTDVPANAP
jgi:hypothetical protein